MHNSSELDPAVQRTCIEAIARKRLLAVDYNGNRMLLAPHQLFARHGDLFISALNTAKTWRDDSERRLGQFKLAGLSNVALEETGFEPLPASAYAEPREGDEQLFSV
ncbi:hypothetical protein [Tsuneonella sp. HG222]